MAYRTGDFRQLTETTGDKELRKVKILVNIKRNAGLVLESELKSIQLTSCRQLTPESIEVETLERWRYYDRPMKPGITLGKVFVADMTLNYAMQKEARSWKVIKVSASSSKFIDQSN